ncbi:O-antigen polymerase [Actinoplanes sp. SE50]|uniref:lipopolysaccharide biosynthesis protein n=1 Tax=unclassified Actinoplanes TaxID=2626549 RepID=UPI0009AF7C7E|nr:MULTISPECIES: hypothetical protein [unclassified Actinoplanes]ATO84826.1 O-antigen polymerase [Actinoplanes sp. SE50]SLM02236.1 putative polysaccharide biosynthesis protein [Actinoplanes sp. SE50/110]
MTEGPGLRPVLRDYVTSLAVQWFVLGTGLALFHLVARRGSVGGFAFYQIARSVASTLQPPLMFGLALGLQRYLPHTAATTRRLVRQALLAETVLVTVAGLIAVAAGPGIAGLLGLPGGRSAVVAIAVLLGGNCLCTIAFAALRGTRQVTGANLVYGLGLGLIPLIAFVSTARIEDFLLVQGVGAGLAAAGGMLAVRGRFPPVTGPEPTLRTLLSYGARRTPGELALPAFYTVPALAVAVAMPGRPEAGYAGFTTSAVALVCAQFAMLTPVLMPRLSRHFTDRGQDDAAVRRLLRALPTAAGVLAAIPVAVIVLAAPVLIHRFLGAEFTAAVPVLRLGVPAAVPLAMFYAARPTLETTLAPRLLSRLLLGCLALQVVVTTAGMAVLAPPHAAVLGLAAAATALGLDAARRSAHAVRVAR